MNLREEILREHSKSQAANIADFIGDDKQRFDALMYLFLNDEYRVCQRAAMVVGIIAVKYPNLVLPFIEPMLQNLKDNSNQAVVRNTVRVLNYMEIIPESSVGLATSFCFNYVADPSAPIAVRAFSIHFLAKICQKEPDLKEELKLLLEDLIFYESPALVSASRNALKKLQKIPPKSF